MSLISSQTLEAGGVEDSDPPIVSTNKEGVIDHRHRVDGSCVVLNSYKNTDENVVEWDIFLTTESGMLLLSGFTSRVMFFRFIREIPA